MGVFFIRVCPPPDLWYNIPKRRRRMEKVNTFFDGMNKLDPVAANKALTDNHYSKDAALKLAAEIMETLRPHIEKNKEWLKTNRNVDYEVRKDFIRTALEILLQKYPSHTVKPKIYFKEDTEKNGLAEAPLLKGVSCMFFEKNFVPYAQQAREILGNDEPFFAFFYDLSGGGPGLVGGIVHEFTHYLQATKQSSIPKEVGDLASKYYKLPTENRDIYRDSIFEVEAHATGGYASERTFGLMGFDLSFLKQMQNQKD